jgi:hypothetical protein
VYNVLLVGVTCCEPLAGTVPNPEIVTLVAFVVVQVNVTVPPF